MDTKYQMYDTVRVADAAHPMHDLIGVVKVQRRKLVDGVYKTSYKVQFGSGSLIEFEEWQLAPNPLLDSLSKVIREAWDASKDPKHKPRGFRETIREKVIDRLVATGRVTRITALTAAVEAVTAPDGPRPRVTDDGEALCRAYGLDPNLLHGIEVKAFVGELTEITTHGRVTKVGDKRELGEVIEKHYRVYPHTPIEGVEPTP